MNDTISLSANSLESTITGSGIFIKSTIGNQYFITYTGRKNCIKYYWSKIIKYEYK